MSKQTATKATVADVTALVAEALNWSHPWTTEQSERVAALAPYVRLFYSRLNEALVLRQYPLGCRVQVLDYKSKYAGQVGVIDKHYYGQSPTRGSYIDAVRVVIDAATDTAADTTATAIAVPYINHIRKVE